MNKPEIDAFMADVADVFRKHNLMLFVDRHDSFVIQPLNESDMRTLLSAYPDPDSDSASKVWIIYTH